MLDRAKDFHLENPPNYAGRVLLEDSPYTQDFKEMVREKIDFFNLPLGKKTQTYLTLFNSVPNEPNAITPIWVEGCTESAAELLKCKPEEFNQVLQDAEKSEIGLMQNGQIIERKDLNNIINKMRTRARHTQGLQDFPNEDKSIEVETHYQFNITKHPDGKKFTVFLVDNATIQYDAPNDTFYSYGTLSKENNSMGAIHQLESRANKQDETIGNVQRDLTLALEQINLLQEIAFKDRLTGIYNRHIFEERLPKEMSRTERADKPLSLIIFDLDHFKSVNDDFGHSAGDKVLKKVVRTVEDTVRDDEMFARWGGEEFVILVNGDLADANQLAERVRVAIENINFKALLPGRNKVTASFGVTVMKNKESHEDFVERADGYLYYSKTVEDRNCVSSGQEQLDFPKKQKPTSATPPTDPTSQPSSPENNSLEVQITE